jgi:arylsulfatase B/arylsulfatase I/J
MQAVLVVLALLLCCHAAAAKKLPNIVFVLADDLGHADIGYHGGAGQGIRTPVLDKLAQEGMRLENYYVQPICTPTRGTLMSGMC